MQPGDRTAACDCLLGLSMLRKQPACLLQAPQRTWITRMLDTASATAWFAVEYSLSLLPPSDIISCIWKYPPTATSGASPVTSRAMRQL